VKSITLIHPASIRLLIDDTWEFAKDTLWKKFPFYEREVEAYKNYLREYYESIPPESFPEIASKYFIFFCVKILLIKIESETHFPHNSKFHSMEPIFLTNLNEDEFRKLLKETLREVLNENGKILDRDVPQILDVKQAAKFLRLEITTLYEKTSRKLIPHSKRGNKLYFNSSELKAWIEQGKVKTRDEIDVEATNYLLRKRRLGN